MSSFKVHAPATPERKASSKKKMQVAWGGYWILLFAMIFVVGERMAGSVFGAAVVIGWIAAWAYLVAVVADCASLLGKSSTVWGGGTFVLGPLGALVLPGLLLLELRK